MSLVLDLTPEQEEQVRAWAAERGQSPADFLLTCAGLAPPPVLPASLAEQLAASARRWEGKTLAKAFAGRTGTVNSAEHNGGQPSRLSERTGEAFTEYLLEKKRQGRL